VRGVAAAGDRVGELVGAVAELSVTCSPRCTMVSAMRVPDCSSWDTTSPAAQGQVEHERVARVLRVCFTSSTRLEMVSASWLPVSITRSVISCERVFISSTIDSDFLREALGHLIEPRRHHAAEVGGDLGEFVADVIGLEGQRLGQAVAGGGNGLRRFLAGFLEAVEQVAAAVAERFDHRVAGISERSRDVFGLFRERVGDPPRRLVDLLGHEFADLGNVVAEIEMDAVDGVADLAGLADERVALAAQILEQARMRTRCRCRHVRGRRPRSRPGSRARRRAPARARCRRPWRRPRVEWLGRR
jgi:hypothetical protein